MISDRFIGIRFDPSTLVPPLFAGLVPVVIAGYILGYKWAVLVAGAGNALGALIFPAGMGWWPERTVHWMLSALVIGLFVYRRGFFGRSNLKLVIGLICGLLLYWVMDVFLGAAIAYNRLGGDYWIRVGARALPLLGLAGVIFAISYPLVLSLKIPLERFLIEDEEEDDQD